MIENITSRKNPRVLHIKKLGADKSYRRASGEYLCDGMKLFNDALSAGAGIRSVLFCGDTPPDIPPEAEVYRVPQDILDYVSPLKNPQNIIFTCAMPHFDYIPSDKDSIIILENMQDPGNVGTMIRTAEAFGIDWVMLAGACADPYGPKSVRGSMGGVFRQNLAETDIDGIAALKALGMRLLGAALTPGAAKVGEANLSGAAIIIGSEGQGISPELSAICDGHVIIPMEGGAESLNAGAAAAIIMWEMKKSRKG